MAFRQLPLSAKQSVVDNRIDFHRLLIFLGNTNTGFSVSLSFIFFRLFNMFRVLRFGFLPLFALGHDHCGRIEQLFVLASKHIVYSIETMAVGSGEPRVHELEILAVENIGEEKEAALGRLKFRNCPSEAFESVENKHREVLTRLSKVVAQRVETERSLAVVEEIVLLANSEVVDPLKARSLLEKVSADPMAAFFVDMRNRNALRKLRAATPSPN
jgi:hypothetical protein